MQGCLDSECRSRGTNFTGAVRPCVGASIHASFSGKCHQPPVPLPAARVPLLLIVHVASGGRALSINRSIAAMGRGVDWLLLPHREMHVAALQPLTRCGSLLGHACGRGDELDLTSVLVKAPREESAARFRPKLLFQLNAAGVAKRRRREYVWLADDDISFVGLDVAGYFALHASVGAPLISAPLISARLSRGGATQKPEFLSNRRQWAAALRRPARPRAVPCALVEQHAPLLDAAFFEWLAGASSGSRGVALRELAALQDAAGSDWGLDMLWCGAARAYAFETAVDAGALRTPCALLLGVAIDHQNSRTIAKHDTTATEGETLTFIDRGASTRAGVHAHVASRRPHLDRPPASANEPAAHACATARGRVLSASLRSVLSPTPHHTCRIISRPSRIC